MIEINIFVRLHHISFNLCYTPDFMKIRLLTTVMILLSLIANSQPVPKVIEGKVERIESFKSQYRWVDFIICNL